MSLQFNIAVPGLAGQFVLRHFIVITRGHSQKRSTITLSFITCLPEYSLFVYQPVPAITTYRFFTTPWRASLGMGFCSAI